ncbi:uncharacterized protein LOC119459592 [Dermacentor silvarum]|uniref:uncharacterized protein LOC119459592 n=1 Tax=Dermacentor silvarum TaxID=543639 RepID=UPI002101A3BB|nr:uncharacterized protein LOC119459592 [Dermacentor silvarum]
MFKLALVVLLCSVFVASKMDNFFEGCVEKPEEEQKPGDCIIAPHRWLTSNTYRRFAHKALENSTIQPDEGNLNTLLELTRAAAQLSHGIIIRVEFTTVESTCNSSVAYSAKQCLPIGSAANGHCQARFRFYGHLRLQHAWCGPLNED